MLVFSKYLVYSCEIGKFEIKVKKNYNNTNNLKFPISGGILPDISLDDKYLNNKSK